MTVFFAPASSAAFHPLGVPWRVMRSWAIRCAAVLLLVVLAQQVMSWPDMDPLAEEIPSMTAVFERESRTIQAAGRVPFWVQRPYEELGKNIMLAVLVAEDQRFFEHNGFDVTEVRKAVLDAVRERTMPRGASTITQQLARNLWLSPSRNPVRKAKEALLTAQLENTLTKRRILELYLNVVQFGPQSFGAEAAAGMFFGKSAADLSEREAAQLAASLPAPRQWYPGSGSEAYSARVERILKMMRSHRSLLRRL